MKLSFAAFAALTIALLAAARPALSEDYANGWTERGKNQCESKDDGQIRCLLDAEPTATVIVGNRNGSKVDFKWDEWHSLCGASGGKVVASSTAIEGRMTKTILPLSAGAGINCREIFLKDCKIGRVSVKCTEVLLGTKAFYKGNLQ